MGRRSAATKGCEASIMNRAWFAPVFVVAASLVSACDARPSCSPEDLAAAVRAYQLARDAVDALPSSALELADALEYVETTAARLRRCTTR
jgi:hypothetical protein